MEFETIYDFFLYEIIWKSISDSGHDALDEIFNIERSSECYADVPSKYIY